MISARRIDIKDGLPVDTKVDTKDVLCSIVRCKSLYLPKMVYRLEFCYSDHYYSYSYVQRSHFWFYGMGNTETCLGLVANFFLRDLRF
jgi:hypothetical protein